MAGGTSTQCNKIILLVIILVLMYLIICKNDGMVSNFFGGVSRLANGNSGDGVKKLDAKELKKAASSTTDVTFVKMYMPNCGFCVKMANDWRSLASVVKKNKNDYPNVVIAEFDATDSAESNELARELGAVAFPTLILFKNGNKVEYQGQRAVKEWRTFLDNQGI